MRKMKRIRKERVLTDIERKIYELELRYEGLEERKRDAMNEGYFEIIDEIEEEQVEIVRQLNSLKNKLN